MVIAVSSKMLLMAFAINFWLAFASVSGRYREGGARLAESEGSIAAFGMKMTTASLNHDGGTVPPQMATRQSCRQRTLSG